MIVVAQFIWVAALLASTIAILWLVSRAVGDRDRIEELTDRVDQILDRIEKLIDRIDHTSSAQPPARPLPTPGPATVPTATAIDSGYRALTTGRHARSE